ncbi:MAG: hypothetical protein ABSA46_01635 [Thermodesulfovibrionales bacterium]|jgi:hypothetical protein
MKKNGEPSKSERKSLDLESKKGELLKDLITTEERDVITAEMDKLGGMISVLGLASRSEMSLLERGKLGPFVWDMEEKFRTIETLVRKVV